MSCYEDGHCRRKRWSEWSTKAKVGTVVGALVLAPAFLVLFPFVTMQLWNWLMPALFKLPAIGFWQAVGILILSHILFKGGHMGKARGSRWKKPDLPNESKQGERPPTPA